MNTTSSPPTTVNARALLMPFALTMIVAMALVQVVIAVSGGRITVLSGILTALVAAGIALWLWRRHRSLTRVRFGVVIAHTLAFVTVTTSFTLHATIRAIWLGSTPGGFDAVAHELLATPWFGVTLVMGSLWGIGLLLHLIGTIAGRGWED